MSVRASQFGGGQPGSVVEYRGDLPAPDRTYAASITDQNIASNLQIPASNLATRSAIVQRRPRRNGHQFFYSHGGVPMENPFHGPSGYGRVQSSNFQRVNVRLMDWMKNLSWFESGYPRNLGWSERSPQIETQYSGNGVPTQTVRPLFTRVQRNRRASATVRTYSTTGV